MFITLNSYVLNFLKKAVKKIEGEYDEFKRLRAKKAKFTNLDHIVNTSLNHLKGAMQFLEMGLDSPFSEKELKKIINDVNDYFKLLKEYPEFMDKEINGEGFFPKLSKKSVREYVKHSSRLLKKERLN